MSTTMEDVRARAQAELDGRISRLHRPARDTFKGMFPLHEDIELSDAQIQIVLDYVAEVDFHVPGATSRDFLVVRWARYTGFQFLKEPLEAYAIGLRCTHPGLKGHHTFIRMSWGQLMGDPEASHLPVNDPVLASDMLMLNRYRDTRTGPSATGVDSYATRTGDGIPGVDFDLKLLEGALDDVLVHEATGTGREINAWWDPAVNWGVAMAGRYPRLKYFESKGRLNEEELASLRAFEQRASEAEPVLQELGLASPAPIADATLKQAERAERGSVRYRHRIRNPRPLTESRPMIDLADSESRPYTQDREGSVTPSSDGPKPGSTEKTGPHSP